MSGRILLAAFLLSVALTLVSCGLEEDQRGGLPVGAGAAGPTSEVATESDGGYRGVRPTTSDFIFTGESEPPDEPGVYAIAKEYRDEWLPEYARDTAQLVVHENGSAEIIWDKEAALQSGSPDDLPFCQNFPESPKGEWRDPTPEDFDSDPVCRGMADATILGPPSYPGPAGPTTYAVGSSAE